MPHHRRIGVVTGAALLLLTATGCSGLGRSTVGSLSFTHRDAKTEVTLSNTSVLGCHRLGPRGATGVVNNTLVDVILYRTPNCRKVADAGTSYVATSLSSQTAPGSLPWRSFSVVH
ncbi:hypothetical protein [Streptomyces sp. NPDC051567]|uniref:hypothetical protein n=1 Tax=Streptomyces sp. NPDC051567 TaxID=3365660 RepID=UPI00378F6080